MTSQAVTGSDLSKHSILVAIGVVVCVGVTGSVFAHENAVSIIGFCSFVCVSLLTLLQQIKTETKLEEVTTATVKEAIAVKDALKVSDEVAKAARDKLQTSMDETKATGDKIHILVNSSMSAQLKISMIALRRIAAMTGNADDIQAAEIAEQLFHEHELKQSMVDSKTLLSEPEKPKQEPK